MKGVIGPHVQLGGLTSIPSLEVTPEVAAAARRVVAAHADDWGESKDFMDMLGLDQ